MLLATFHLRRKYILSFRLFPYEYGEILMLIFIVFVELIFFAQQTIQHFLLEELE